MIKEISDSLHTTLGEPSQTRVCRMTDP
jgi:hypothetical protein